MTATQWLEVLCSYSLQVLAVVAACKLLERAVVSASDRCAIWNGCFLSIAGLTAAALLLPRLHLIQPWKNFEPQGLVNVSATQAHIGRTLLVIWSLGASVAIACWIGRGMQLRCALRRCEAVPDEIIWQLIDLPDAGSERRLPAVLISDEFDGPFCWQLHKPTVVLPRYLLNGHHDDLRHVLLHELEHLRTNHPLQLFFQHLAEVICWFHPAVWRAGSWAALSREFSCDEAAARHGTNCAAYLRTLLHIAEHCEQKRNASTIGFGRTPSEIVLRARRLVSLATNTGNTQRRRFLNRQLAICMLIALTCCIGLITLPIDSLASSRSMWSPWPSWTAKSAHCFGFALRDYEQFDPRIQVFEIAHEAEFVPPATADAIDR
jgi:beta-lactamase regulating signal transducer with metallopeptidase domain